MEPRPLITRPAIFLRGTDGRRVTTCG